MQKTKSSLLLVSKVFSISQITQHQTSPKEFKVNRVMKKTNCAINRKYFLDLRGKAVNLKKLSKSDSDILFYNSYFGSSVEEAKVISFKFSDFKT